MIKSVSGFQKTDNIYTSDKTQNKNSKKKTNQNNEKKVNTNIPKESIPNPISSTYKPDINTIEKLWNETEKSTSGLCPYQGY